MKKILISLIIGVMIICIGISSYAETTPNIELNFDKNMTINQETKEITLKLSLGDFTGIEENAMIGLKGILKYSTSIFSQVTVTGINGYTATYSSATQRILIDPKVGTPNTEVAEIKLTLNDEVEPCTTNISFQLEEFTDGTNDFTLSTKAVAITIEKKEEPSSDEDKTPEKPSETPDETQKTETPATTDKATSSNLKEDETKSNTNLPKTGNKTMVVIVAIVLTIGVACLIRYKKIEI